MSQTEERFASSSSRVCLSVARDGSFEAFESAIPFTKSLEQHLGGTEMSRAVTVSGDPSGLRQTVLVGPHLLLSDEPKEAGGEDQGPDPYELLLAALGSCTNMTLRIYAERKRWPLREVRVVLKHLKSYATDCADCERPTAMLDRIERQITLIGELTEEQRQRLLEIASLCPVHRTLTSKIEIHTGLAEPS
jgi:putative redox protein